MSEKLELAKRQEKAQQRGLLCCVVNCIFFDIYALEHLDSINAMEMEFRSRESELTHTIVELRVRENSVMLCCVFWLNICVGTGTTPRKRPGGAETA